jgi:Sel1 repeat
MSFLPRLRFGRDRETEVLRQRVRALEAALKRSSERADWWTLKREVATAIAVVLLAVGFTLGVYREPIKQSVVGMARAAGIAKQAVDPYVSFDKGDYRTALRLARVLADEDDTRAQRLLGVMYYYGQGVSRDYTEAAKWFRLAADQGDPDAQFYVGVLYTEGLGVPEDYAEGAKWYRLAADQGDAQAQYNLGVFYSKEQLGRHPDYVSAYMWFNLAAAHFKPSDPRRNTAIKSRELMERLMTPAQLAEGQRRAREWMPAGA